jgi:Flp pilus assembly pilin Flp
MTRKGVRPLFADERGQTTTEYVMIAGLMLAIAVSWIGVMYPTTQDILRKVAECVISDVCDGGSSPFGW